MKQIYLINLNGERMAWVCVFESGAEYIFYKSPLRYIPKSKDYYKGWIPQEGDKKYHKLPSGSIKKLIGRELKWEDEPVEL